MVAISIRTARDCVVVPCLMMLMGCERSAPATSASSETPATVDGAAVTAAAGSNARSAEIGKPAPDFSLMDLDGKSVSLHDFRGKTVVLEWFNPGCPFARASHTKASLKTFPAEQILKGVVWLAINSAAQGKQGHEVGPNVEAKKAYGMTYPVLLDGSGETGRRYGATSTPHMFVIDKEGILVYQGAIDNSPDGEGESPESGKLVNYVATALDAMAAGRPVEVKSTKAYGCAVKY